MFGFLKKPMRTRLAACLAAAYAICALIPSAALALSNGERAAHCFSLEQASHQFAHVHKAAAKQTIARDKTAHDHALHKHAVVGLTGDAGDSSRSNLLASSGNCCGVFCVSALSSSFELTAVYAPLSASLEPPVTGFMSGQEPSRIDRPPRSLVLI